MDNSSNKGEIVIYTSPDGHVCIDARFHDETLWLTQKAMAELFGVKTPAISKHLKNIFIDGELKEDLVMQGIRDNKRNRLL